MSNRMQHGPDGPFGSYLYFAREWTTFRAMCKDPETDMDDLDVAFQALWHLAGKTEDPPPSSDTNIEQLLRVAMMLYERATLNLMMGTQA